MQLSSIRALLLGSLLVPPLAAQCERDLVLPPAPESVGFFGYAVDLEGDRAIVGAPHSTDGWVKAGAAFVLEYANGTWTVVERLDLGSKVGPGSTWGGAVALANGRAFVGRHSGLGVLVFEEIGSGWELVAEIDAPYPTSSFAPCSTPTATASPSAHRTNRARARRTSTSGTARPSSAPRGPRG